MDAALAVIPFCYIILSSGFFSPKLLQAPCCFSTESEAMHLCPVEAAYWLLI